MSGPSISPPFSGVLNDAGLARTEQWRALVDRVLAGNGTGHVLTTPLVLGVIYAESRGFPNEASGSATDWFSSFGLMQVNAAQHWQNTGRPLADLMDPETNVDLGTRILASLVSQHGGDGAAAISAYNGGGKRYPAGTRFCQVWKPGTPSSGRDIDTMCDQAYVTQEGEFGNQPYVDEVLTAGATFAPDGVVLNESGMEGGLGGTASVVLLGAALLGAAAISSFLGGRS